MSIILPQTIITGFLMGGIYGLVALGLSITFGVMKIMNMSQGDFLMVAMYATFFTVTIGGITPYSAMFIVFTIMFVFGMILFRLLISHIMPKHQMYQMLFTMGLSFFLQNVILAFFSPNYRFVKSTVGSASFNLFGAHIDMSRFIAFVVSIVITGVLFWFLKSTDLGRSIRAASQDKDAAAYSGINVKRVFTFTFAIGVALTGVAGPLLAPIIPINPTVGNYFLTFALMSVVLGGLGNFYGTLMSAFILSIALEFGNAFLPGSLGPVLPFSIFILVLLFKPEGIWGVRAR